MKNNLLAILALAQRTDAADISELWRRMDEISELAKIQPENINIDNKIYLVMLDVETVDRAFSTYEKAHDYLKARLEQHPFYMQHPELLEAHIVGDINEADFDKFN